jgi:RTX calcium-binding nonapeptide repeat (4 copies)
MLETTFSVDTSTDLGILTSLSNPLEQPLTGNNDGTGTGNPPPPIGEGSIGNPPPPMGGDTTGNPPPPMGGDGTGKKPPMGGDTTENPLPPMGGDTTGNPPSPLGGDGTGKKPHQHQGGDQNHLGKPPVGNNGNGNGNAGDKKPVNTIRGGVENDKLVGKKGNDILIGGDGDDILVGGQGNDSLVGGAGNDVLFGIKGSNKMQGGEGSDTFVLGRGRSLNLVKDFNAAEGDKLALPGKLNFDKLSFTQKGQNTVISQGDRKIATLFGVKADSIGANDFVTVPSLNPPASSRA